MVTSTGSSIDATSIPSVTAKSPQPTNRSNSSDDLIMSSTSSTAGNEIERSEMSPRSFSDPATGTPAASSLSRSNSESYRPSSGAGSPGGKRNSRQSLPGDPVDEEKRMALKKRYSGSNHTNLHTECGRHGDDWLVGPLIDTVKDAMNAMKTITGGKPR